MLWFLLALVCFVVSAFWDWETIAWRKPSLIALGLAFFTLVFFWTAFKAV